MHRIERPEHLGSPEDLADAEHREQEKPDHHDRAEKAPIRAVPSAERGTGHQHGNGDRDDEVLERQESAISSLRPRQDRDGGRDHAVAVEEAAPKSQRRTQAPGRCCRRSVASARSAMMPPSPWLSARRIRVMYLTETTIISAQKIARGCRARGRGRRHVAGAGRFVNGVERAGADVAVDDAEGAERQRRKRAFPGVVRRLAPGSAAELGSGLAAGDVSLCPIVMTVPGQAEAAF